MVEKFRHHSKPSVHTSVEQWTRPRSARSAISPSLGRARSPKLPPDAACREGGGDGEDGHQVFMWTVSTPVHGLQDIKQ